MCSDVSTVGKCRSKMTKEKTKQDVKKADEKKQNDFWKNIKGLSKVDTHFQTLCRLQQILLQFITK